jgi:hypothetical protein
MNTQQYQSWSQLHIEHYYAKINMKHARLVRSGSYYTLRRKIMKQDPRIMKTLFGT